MKLTSFFIVRFCSLSLLFVGLDCAQNTKGIAKEQQTSGNINFGLTRKTRQCTELQILLFKFVEYVELPNKLVFKCCTISSVSLQSFVRYGIACSATF